MKIIKVNNNKFTQIDIQQLRFYSEIVVLSFNRLNSFLKEGFY